MADSQHEKFQDEQFEKRPESGEVITSDSDDDFSGKFELKSWIVVLSACFTYLGMVGVVIVESFFLFTPPDFH